MFNKGNYLSKINKHLMLLALGVRSKNRLGLTDDSKLSEDFFKGLVNLILGYDFKNLNTAETDYAGIDLGDESKRLCIQVTADDSSEKIKKTLAVSDKYKRYETYDTLVVLIIGFKRAYSTEFTSSFPNFDKKKHIWDIDDILKKIYAIDDMSLLKKIVGYLDEWLGTIIRIDPVELTESDLASIVDVLFKYAKEGAASSGEQQEKKYKIVYRDQSFIDKKNALNSVSQAFFDAEISPALQYAKDIENFLSNPINKDYQEKYFSLTAIFQDIYSQNTAEFDNNLESFFSYLFRGIVNWENRNQISAPKLLVVLGNMYFNCDIGNNPA